MDTTPLSSRAPVDAPTDLAVRILGPLEVTVGGEVVALGSHKQRAVLAALALRANQVVSLDRLIEQLWGEQPPAAAAGSLQAYVSNLRRALQPDRRAGERLRHLVTQAPGYLLRIGPAAVDAARFEAAASEGRRLLAAGSAAAARRALETALAEWRGPVLADFAFDPFAQAAAARLEELRLVATEDLLDARIAVGDHAGAVPELEALVAAHPLRERMWELLLLALYRSGRQGEALRAYQAARRTLAEELGIEPGPALRRLEGDILGQSPSLSLAEPTTAQLAQALAELTSAVAELKAHAAPPGRRHLPYYRRPPRCAATHQVTSESAELIVGSSR